MKLHVHFVFVYRKTGALLDTTFVLSLHVVFHNVICNWRNCALQFLSIIILSCPLQRAPYMYTYTLAYIYIYVQTHTYAVDLIRIYFHEFYEYLSKTEKFCWHAIYRGPKFHCPRIFSFILAEVAGDPDYHSFASKRITVTVEIHIDFQRNSQI